MGCPRGGDLSCRLAAHDQVDDCWKKIALPGSLWVLFFPALSLGREHSCGNRHAGGSHAASGTCYPILSMCRGNGELAIVSRVMLVEQGGAGALLPHP